MFNVVFLKEGMEKEEDEDCLVVDSGAAGSGSSSPVLYPAFP